MHNARNRVVLGGTCDVVMLVARSVDDGRGRRSDVRVGIAGWSREGRGGEREERERERGRERESSSVATPRSLRGNKESFASSLNETSWPPRGNTRASLSIRVVMYFFHGWERAPPFSRL